MPYAARRVTSDHCPSFVVAGGTFPRAQIMAWHIITDAGETVAVSHEAALAERLNDLEALVAWLESVDGAYQLRELMDDGLIP